jgi:serine/threonine protein kinase
MNRPHQLAGFEIIEKLGEGGMASVWKARQISLDRIVAIKILSDRLAADPADILRFQTEARAAAKLKHPGIVQVYDANAEHGLYYFVMEYIAGYTTGDWVRRKQRIPEREALLVCECVADALAYAWDRERIIHCDIKPDNVMVDEDGSVKVADLGLARTISVMADADEPQDIMGTPAYISPEQAEGASDLDCRADIYSLGATLFHLLTGQMLFHGNDPETIIDLQISDSVPDPIDTVPGLSKGVCWLMERMLAKDRNLRQSSWESVKEDIARVRKGLQPQGKPLPSDSSTLRRSPRRLVADYRRAVRIQTASAATRTPLVKIFLGIGLIGGVLLGAWNLTMMAQRRPTPVSVPTVTSTTQAARAPVESHTDRRARQVFEYAQQWERANSNDLTNAILNYQRAAAETQGTRYSLMAQTEATRLANRLQTLKQEVIDRLKREVAPLIENRRYNEAAAHIRNYSGLASDETRDLRRQMAARLLEQVRSMAGERERLEKEAAAAVEQAYRDAVAGVLNGDLPGAVLAVSRVIETHPRHAATAALREVRKTLQGAMRSNDQVLESFNAQRGQSIDVQFNTGTKRVVIDSVAGGRVICKHVISTERYMHSVISFGIGDLSSRERLLRMGADSDPAVALAKGIMACESKAYEHARKYFSMTIPALADRLRHGLDEFAANRGDAEAEQALASLLRSFGYGIGAYEHDAWLQAVQARRLDATLQARVEEYVVQFVRLHGGTAFAAEVSDILDALRAATAVETTPEAPPPPAGGTGLGNGADASSAPSPLLGAEIAGARGNTADAIRLLGERNRKADMALVDTTLKDGVCVGLRIRDGAVDDLAPVAALTGLREFAYDPAGNDAPGRLRILDPLRTLPLESVTIVNCRVNLLRSLQSLPLKLLNVSRTDVRDLAPLRGMALTSVACADTKVLDLSPLGAMQIEYLDVHGTQVGNARPLAGMPLRHLDVSGTRINDFSFLRSLSRLEWLNVSDTGFRRLDDIASRVVRTLALNNTRVQNIALVAELPLTEFDAADTPITDFSPLSKLALRKLGLAGTSLADLAVCAGMPLNSLDVHTTSVASLAPLKGMPLQHVNIANTRVSDLEPLRGAPLVYLVCRGARVSDLSPLRGSPIKALVVDDALVPHALSLGLPKLHTINGKRWEHFLDQHRNPRRFGGRGS